MAEHGKPDDLITLQELAVSNAYEIARMKQEARMATESSLGRTSGRHDNAEGRICGPVLVTAATAPLCRWHDSRQVCARTANPRGERSASVSEDGLPVAACPFPRWGRNVGQPFHF